MSISNSFRIACVALGVLAAPAWAALGDPIKFTSSGTLTLEYTGSEGGFDHVLELANTPGPVGGSPILVATSPDPVSSTVLGFTPADLPDTFALGAYAANTELIFRMTNVMSARIDGGKPGDIVSQIFSGTSGSLNPAFNGGEAGLPYVKVTPISPTVLAIGFEDLDPTRTTFDNLTFTLTLAPIPEPHEWAMMLAGLGMVGVVARRRRAVDLNA